jgi:hypothetical protein
MRRFVKPAVWAAAFLACAGAGAFLAANTDPFPPGVDRPTGTGPTGGTGLTGPSPSPEPVIQRWGGVMRWFSRHDLYVGGSCRSRWQADLRISVGPEGAVDGRAVARPVGTAACDFQQAQEQANRLRFTVRGVFRAGRLRLVIVEVRPSPTGSTDVGGTLVVLPGLRMLLPTELGVTAEGEFSRDRSDGNRGTFSVAGSTRLHCQAACPA